MSSPSCLPVVAWSLALSVLLSVTVHAAETSLPRPEGDVILTLTGNIANANVADKALFDRTMLHQLPQTSFTTTTIWTEGEGRFTGVLLRDLLVAVGSEGRSLKAIALNDYAVEIPASDKTSDSALVAYEVDGEPMSVRDKGPLWIVYPYDSASRFQTETVYSRSIWQLTQIEVLD